MTTRGEINSNFYQIVDVDANGAPTLVKPEFIGPVQAVDADLANVHISGGTNGYVLQTDGTGNLSWTAQTGGGGNGVPGGSNTQVQFNDEGSFAGDDNFKYDKTTQLLTANNFSSNTANLGELYVEGNIQSNTAVYVGYTANATGLTNPTIIAKRSGATYVQAAIVNGSPNGSADYVTYGDNGSDSGAWADMGFTGSNFDDPNYTITGINDGYFFVLGDDSSAHGGNLVIATGHQGSTKDIVFATGGFLASDEKMRFVHSAGQFQIQPNTISTSTTTGALVVTGGIGAGGDINAGNVVSANFIIGDGGYLSNVNFTGNVSNANYSTYSGTAFNVAGANVTGNVSQAVHAYFADVANSVAGANVSGYVANATHATVSDSANTVAGANVTGTVALATHANVADSANSVSAANVVGIVANANYASYAGNAVQANVSNVANSVSLANVVGIGNIASINLTGSSSNVLYGNGVFASIGANISANFASYAGNVTVNAQPNITSVGNLSNLQFNTSVTPFTANAGDMFWDTSEQTITLGMNNGVQQQIGLESYILVKASAAITDGQAVMFTGASGTNLTGAPANAASSGFKPGYILGIATQSIANNAFGYVTVTGMVHGLNTVAWNLGDMLWYDPTSTTGALTNIQPVDPNFQIQVGFVTRKNASDGHIQVRLEPLTSLTNLTDVSITTPSIGQTIIYAGANVWVNGDPEHANIANIANVAYSVSGSNVTGQVANALVAGTVYTNAQPNITSLGTLANLTVAGNLSVTANGIVNLGNVANVKIGGGTGGYFLVAGVTSGDMNWVNPTTANLTLGNLTIGNTLTVSSTSKLKFAGGTSGQFLQTDGASNLVWANTITTPAGADTQVQYNSNGVMSASNTFTFSSDFANSISPSLTVGSAVTGQSASLSLIGTSLLGASSTALIYKPSSVSEKALTIKDPIGVTFDGNTTGTFSIFNMPSVNIGSAANLHITGGLANQFLQTDGAGNLTWAAGGGGGGGTPGGSTGSIQFNTGGSFDGTVNFTYVDQITGNSFPSTMTMGNTSILSQGANLVLAGRNGNTSFTQNALNGGLTITALGSNSAVGFVANTISLGSNANINITGGSSGQVLSTDGAGNLSWATASGSSATDFTPSFLLGGM